jgi:hypothetical protein
MCQQQGFTSQVLYLRELWVLQILLLLLLLQLLVVVVSQQPLAGVWWLACWCWCACGDSYVGRPILS